MHKTRAACALALVMLCGALLAHRPLRAATGGFGVLGDSGSDEYRADDNRGGTYAATTLNWVELLARKRQLDFGAWGTRGEPRRTGYEYNWARSNARIADVNQGGQASGLAQQVSLGLVSTVVLNIGANDFAIFNGTYADIYNGVVSGAALDARIADLVANIALSVDTVRNAGPVSLYVCTLPDRGNTPAFIAAFPNAANRQIVSAAIGALNAGIRTLAAERGATIIDMDGLNGIWLQRIDASGNLKIGGELISTTVPGNEPHHAQLGDGEHAGTVAEGLLANYILGAFNTAGMAIPAFTDEELLANAGIVSVPPDTTVPQVMITGPATGASVSGTISISANASDNVAVTGVQFSVDGVALGGKLLSPPYVRQWNSSTAKPGPHTIAADASDAAGNVSRDTITVTALDVTLPSVAITAPASGAHVAGTFTVTASASDNDRVSGVTFYLSGTPLGAEDTSAPYSVAVPTTFSQNGTFALTAVARDAAGNSRTSSPVSVVISNPAPDTTPPTVTLTSPADGATIAGTQTLSGTASDNVKVVGVQFRLDGSALGAEDTSAPYTLSWNTKTASNASHTLSATARDAAGNTSTATLTVTVFNPPPETRLPESMAITKGTLVSGTVQSLAAADSDFVVVRAALSGGTGTASADLRFIAATKPISRLDLTVRLKSNQSNSTSTIFVFNVVSGVWVSLQAATLGTSETTRTIAITSSPGNYVDQAGTVLVRVQTARALNTPTMSINLATVLITH